MMPARLPNTKWVKRLRSMIIPIAVAAAGKTMNCPGFSLKIHYTHLPNGIAVFPWNAMPTDIA